MTKAVLPHHARPGWRTHHQVRGDRLYLTDGGVPEPHDAKLQTTKINFAAFPATAGH